MTWSPSANTSACAVDVDVNSVARATQARVRSERPASRYIASRSSARLPDLRVPGFRECWRNGSFRCDALGRRVDEPLNAQDPRRISVSRTEARQLTLRHGWRSVAFADQPDP